MRKSAFLLGSILMFTALGLGGCKKETVESLMTKTVENTKKADSYHVDFSMNVGMKIETSGVRMDMILGGDLGTDYMADPQQYYMDGNFQIELLGQKEEMGLEFYLVPEEESMAAYGKMKFLDQESGWTKTTISEEETDTEKWMEFMEGFQKEQMEMLTSTLRLEETTTTLNETECYHITGEMTGEQIQNVLNQLLQSEEAAVIKNKEEFQRTLETFDLKAISVPVEYWISRSEKLPVKIQIDLKNAMEAVIKNVTELTEQEFQVTFDACSIDMNYHSYNQIKEISVPEEVKENAEKEAVGDIREDVEEILGKTA